MSSSNVIAHSTDAQLDPATKCLTRGKRRWPAKLRTAARGSRAAGWLSLLRSPRGPHPCPPSLVSEARSPPIVHRLPYPYATQALCQQFVAILRIQRPVVPNADRVESAGPCRCARTWETTKILWPFTSLLQHI